MSTAKEIYEAEKIAQERKARALAEQRRAEAKRQQQDSVEGEKQRRTEEARERALKAEKDRIAKKYLQTQVAPQLKDLLRATGGKIQWEDDTLGVNLVLGSERKTFGTKLDYRHQEEIRIDRGVFVDVEFDEENRGHIFVNHEEVTSDLPSALAKGALNPSTEETVLRKPKREYREDHSGQGGHGYGYG